MSSPSAADAAPVDMLIRTVQAAAFRSLFECLKESLYEISLSCTERGLGISAIDNSRCAMVWARLDAPAFEEFSVKPGGWRGGVSVQHLHRLLRVASPTDELVLFVRSAEPHILHIHVINPEKRSITRYAYKLLDVASEDVLMPDAENTVAVSVPSSQFQRLCRDMSALGNEMTITVDGSTLKLGVVGDYASQETELAGSMAAPVDTDAEVVCFSASYSLKFLLSFARAAAMGSTATLYLRKDWPISISYSVGNLGTLRFVLAPSITDA